MIIESRTLIKCSSSPGELDKEHACSQTISTSTTISHNHDIMQIKSEKKK